MNIEQELTITAAPYAHHTIKCPYCSYDDCIRKPRGFIFKKVFFFIPAKHYACGKCLRNFYRFQE